MTCCLCTNRNITNTGNNNNKISRFQFGKLIVPWPCNELYNSATYKLALVCSVHLKMLGFHTPITLALACRFSSFYREMRDGLRYAGWASREVYATALLDAVRLEHMSGELEFEHLAHIRWHL